MTTDLYILGAVSGMDILTLPGFGEPAGIFMLLCWGFFSAYWFVSSLGAKRTAEISGNQGFDWGLRIVMAALIIIIILLERSGILPGTYAGWILWPQGPAVGLFADALTLAGLAIAFWARATLGGNWSGRVVLKENHELVMQGPYKYVRHPIYTGILAMALGAAVYLGRAEGFAVLAFVFISLWVKAMLEERLLSGHFPEYSQYKSNVKAFIPYLF